jgi:hypothetical protein
MRGAIGAGVFLLAASTLAAEGSARVRLGTATPIVTSGLAISKLYLSGPHAHEVLEPFVRVGGAGKTPFSAMKSVTFTPTDEEVRGSSGEHEVRVEIVLRTGTRITGSLTRDGASTVSLAGEGLKVHLSTSEWLGDSIGVEFGPAPEP